MMSIRSSVTCLCCLVMMFGACTQQSASVEKVQTQMNKSTDSSSIWVDSGKHQLIDGDIVLRTGNDVISGMFAQLNQHDKTFSHCGIAFKEKNEWVVYHSIGGEDNPDAKLRRESFEKFVGRAHNLGFGICRYELNNPQIQKLQTTVHEFYSKQIPFDMKFDLKSNDRLYCAEMVFKAFNQALDTTGFFQTTQHQGFEYVSTDNLFVNNKARILCHIVY